MYTIIYAYYNFMYGAYKIILYYIVKLRGKTSVETHKSMGHLNFVI